MKKKHLLRSILTVILCVLMLSGIVAVGYEAIVSSIEKKEITPSIDKDNNLPVVKPVNNSASSSVTTENNVTTSDVTLVSSDGAVSAVVPSGTLLNEGAAKVTLTVKELKDSQANIEIDDSEEKSSIDVHIEGVSASNTTPIKVYIKELLPNGLNMGNYKLYHVENGVAVEMALLVEGETPVHNNFEYDEVTGDVNLYLASFSEVALVADTENAWNGGVEPFASGDGTEDNPYIIANADQLAYLSDRISNDNETYGDAYYKLIADINIGGSDNYVENGVVFYPIGYNKVGGTTTSKGAWYTYGGSFKGVFDGNGHTVSGIYQNTWIMVGDYTSDYYYNDAMGLFGYVNGGTVKNLTVDNFYSEGEFAPTGCVTAYADGTATFENITITNSHPQTYNTGVAGIVGWDNGNSSNFTFKNITVDDTNTVSALWGSWDVAASGILGCLKNGSKVSFENCNVAATIDVYNDVCGNYQYYWYRYSGAFIGTVYKRLDNGNGALDLSDVTATNCTVNFGDRHDYYYCEFVKNTVASYTHEHQFSRVPHSEIVFDADGTAIGCTHGHESAGKETINGVEIYKEDNKAVYIPYRQLFGGYGWGVDGVDLGEYNNIKISDVTTAKEKFKSNVDDESYETGDILTLGDIFSLIDGANVYVNDLNVFVSPAEGSTVTAVYTANSDWRKGTLEFSGVGGVTIGITDYDYCLVTTATITITDVAEPDPVDKFEAKADLTFEHVLENDTINKTLGDIFKALEGAYIVSSDVTLSVDGSCAYELDADDWTSSTLAFTGTGTVAITITDNNKCVSTTAYVTITEPLESDKLSIKFPNVNNYVYRVGNANNIKLSSLFSASLPDGATASVTFNKVEGDVNGVYTANSSWDSGTIKFTGTGIVEITIDTNAYTTQKTLTVEVVNATNVTTYSELQNKNSVLLGDITMTSGSYYISGATLYGNGFTFDVKKGDYTGTNLSSNYLVCLSNANLDNINIVGAVYTEYGAQVANNYNRACVLTTGNCIISNSYISNCASAVRVKDGDLEIANSTIKGGNFANIDVRNGHLTLENVTTINQALDNDKADNGTAVIGLGIVVYYELVDTSSTSITVNGTLTQYNHISSNDKFSHDYATQLVSAMLGSSNSDIQYKDGDVTWVNAGIVSMTEGMSGNITKPYEYTGKTVTFMSVDGYTYTVIPTQESITQNAPAYATLGQGTIAPSYSFDYTSKNYVAKTEGSNDYCYYDNGKVLIAMDQGETFEWDPFILTATKLGNTLNYTVTMNGTTYTAGQKIAFNTSNEYVITYTYTDNYNYDIDVNGELTTVPVVYTKTVVISVSVIQPDTHHAEFAFGSSETATEKLNIGDKTYISAVGVTATDQQWGYITVDGTKVFYPITTAQMIMNAFKTEVQVFYYVFNGVVVITDYQNGGTGGPQVYGFDYQTMPSGLTVVNGMEAKYEGISSACVDISKLTKDGSTGEVWDFSSSNTVSGATTHNSYLAHSSPSGLQVKSGTRDYNAITVAQFSYTDEAGATYYYFAGYYMPNQFSESSTPCVTPDTLVTLADGTQVRVDSLTGSENLLVWNHETGKLESASVAYIVNHDGKTSTEEIIHLYFSDGSEVKIIGEHVFYDATLNKYIAIDTNNAESYIGHKFLGLGNDTLNEVELVSVDRTIEETEVYEVVSYKHLTCFTNGILSTSAYLDKLLNVFDIDTETYAYNAESVQKDIETYGVYTYADFEGLISEEAFELYNAKYLKIAVGKEYITWEDILDLIDIYFNVDVQPIQ